VFRHQGANFRESISNKDHTFKRYFRRYSPSCLSYKLKVLNVNPDYKYQQVQVHIFVWSGSVVVVAAVAAAAVIVATMWTYAVDV
jgi:hypothetical protein